MSQHYLDSKPGCLVIVGFDRPTNAFFGTVWKDGMPIDSFSNCEDVAVLAEAIEDYATLSPTLRETLETERRDRDSHPMTLVVDHRKRGPFDENDRIDRN